MQPAIHSDNVIVQFVDFRNKINRHKFIFSYRGKISHAIVKNLLAMAEKKIDALQEETTLKKKIFGVMVNCLQTICTDDKSDAYPTESIFLISKNDDSFTVYTGKVFTKEVTSKLCKIIGEINQLSKDSLMDLHKEKLQELELLKKSFNIDETILSLINIAKKSDQKINCFVKDREAEYSFFSIQVQIK